MGRILKATAAAAFVFAVTGWGVAADPAPAQKKDEPHGIWGAIAYSETDGEYGFFWGAPDKDYATTEALDHCQNADGKSCKIVSLFRNHSHWDDDDKTGFPYLACSSLAVEQQKDKKNPKYPAAWASSSAVKREDSDKAALQACQKNGAQCEIAEWVCT